MLQTQMREIRMKGKKKAEIMQERNIYIKN